MLKLRLAACLFLLVFSAPSVAYKLCVVADRHLATPCGPPATAFIPPSVVTPPPPTCAGVTPVQQNRPLDEYRLALNSCETRACQERRDYTDCPGTIPDVATPWLVDPSSCGVWTASSSSQCPNITCSDGVTQVPYGTVCPGTTCPDATTVPDGDICQCPDGTPMPTANAGACLCDDGSPIPPNGRCLVACPDGTFVPFGQICPVLCPDPESELQACASDPSVEQSRTRESQLVSGVCAWQPWSEWSPDCPGACPSPESEQQVCPSDASVQQSRTRDSQRVAGVCTWEPWSEWSPDCPLGCPAPESEQQACATDLLVDQSRTRDSQRIAGVCTWQPWSEWSPDCPVACPASESEQQACATDPLLEQSRTRDSRYVFGVCTWQPWSEWSPDCPGSTEQCLSPTYGWSESVFSLYDGGAFNGRLRALGYTPNEQASVIIVLRWRSRPHLGGNSWGPMSDWRMEIGGSVAEGSDVDMYPLGSIQITGSQLGLSPITDSVIPCLFFCGLLVRSCDCPADSPGPAGFTDWHLPSGVDLDTAVPDGPWVKGLFSCG